MITRTLSELIRDSKKSILLLGPRQVGKSTLLKGLKPDLVIDLSYESQFFKFASDPEYFESVVRASNAKLILVDEVQRIPSILNSVQGIIDETKGTGKTKKFLLSGSSARKLRRGQANLLPGRIFSFYLSGISAKEVNYKLDTEHATRFGFLPEAYLERNNNEQILLNYSSLYLKEEIQAEALLRNVHGFARFLNVIAETSGQILDFSKLSTKAKVSRTSSIRFVEILEDTLIAQRIPVFSGATSADTIKHPKIYFFDVGVLNGLLGNFTVSKDRLGNLFEHVVYNQIRNSAFNGNVPFEISYFRTRNGLEVDFIVKIKNKVWAIEVKSGEISDSDTESLLAFRKYFPKVSGLLAVSPREKKRKKREVLICGLNEMLLELGL